MKAVAFNEPSLNWSLWIILYVTQFQWRTRMIWKEGTEVFNNCRSITTAAEVNAVYDTSVSPRCFLGSVSVCAAFRDLAKVEQGQNKVSEVNRAPVPEVTLREASCRLHSCLCPCSWINAWTVSFTLKCRLPPSSHHHPRPLSLCAAFDSFSAAGLNV